MNDALASLFVRTIKRPDAKSAHGTVLAFVEASPEPLSVRQVHNGLGISLSMSSTHLRTLADRGLLQRVKCGTINHYTKV